DLNGDGRLDVVVSLRTDSSSVFVGRICEFLGDGSGGLGPRIDLNCGAGGNPIALGDVNADGRADLAIAGWGVLLNPSATRTVLTAPAGTVPQGATLTLTATIQPTRIYPGSPSTVSFFDGTTLLGTAPVTWTKHVNTCFPPVIPCYYPVYTGTATLSPVMSHGGVRSLSAVFSGDGRRAGSIAPAISRTVLAAPVAVGREPTPTFGLEHVTNPAAGGRVGVSFSLANGAPATLELFDLGGRRVEARDVRALGAGHHATQLGGEHTIRAGVYFIRLRQGANVARARVAVLD
ncbi:MAG TPA: FG-GAP-like repeat-containing protein, partial [Dongiaceae bacterium]|nr:FG-GAP-like repeat-containing protein [Dongiaceae bacterium]